MEQRTATPRFPQSRLYPHLPRSVRHHLPHRATRPALHGARDRSARVRQRATGSCQPRATPHIALPCVLHASQDRSWNPWKGAYAWRHRWRVTAAAAPRAFPDRNARSPRYCPAWRSGTPGARRSF